MSTDVFTICWLLLLQTTLCAVSNPVASAMDSSDQYEVHPVGGPACDLGEGPHWLQSTSSLYYVDAFAGFIHRYQVKEKKHSKVNLGDLVTIVIPIEGSDQLLVSLRNKVRGTCICFKRSVTFDNRLCDSIGTMRHIR